MKLLSIMRYLMMFNLFCDVLYVSVSFNLFTLFIVFTTFKFLFLGDIIFDESISVTANMIQPAAMKLCVLHGVWHEFRSTIWISVYIMSWDKRKTRGAQKNCPQNAANFPHFFLLCHCIRASGSEPFFIKKKDCTCHEIVSIHSDVVGQLWRLLQIALWWR